MKLGDGPRAQRRRSLGATSLAPSRFRGTRPHLGLGHSLHKKTMSGGGLHHRRVLSREILPENILYGQVSTDASHALPAKTWNQLTRFYAAAEDTTRATSPVQQSTPRTQAKTSQAAMLQYRAAALIGNVQSVVQSAPVCSAESESRGDGLGLFRDSITSSKHYRSRSGSADAFAVHPPNTFAQRGRNESTGVVSKRAQDQRDAVRLPDVNLTPRSERSWSGSGIEALGAGGFQAKAAGNAGIENVSDDDDDGSDGSDDDEDVSWLAVERAHTPEYLQRQAFQPILGVSQEKMDETRREKEKEMQQRLYKLRSKIKAASYRLGAHSLYRMFFQADADGDGGVNHEEFIKLCRTFIPNMTSEEEYMFVNLVDDDGSGHIDLKEFQAFMENDLRIKLPKRNIGSQRQMSATVAETQSLLGDNPISHGQRAYRALDFRGQTYRSTVSGSLRASIRKRDIGDVGRQKRNFRRWMNTHSSALKF